MNINKGDEFFCYKDVVMDGGNNDGKKVYTKGYIYKSNHDDHLTDNFGNEYHGWSNEEKVKNHFAKIGGYNGELKGFPELVVQWMLKEQELQGNSRNVKVFEKCSTSDNDQGVFFWKNAKYFDVDSCIEIIKFKDFQEFFDEYPYGVGVKSTASAITDSPKEEVKPTGDTSSTLHGPTTFMYTQPTYPTDLDVLDERLVKILPILNMIISNPLTSQGLRELAEDVATTMLEDYYSKLNEE